MLRKFTSSRLMKGNVQKIILTIIIVVLSMECSFHEPTTPLIQQLNENKILIDANHIDAYTLHKINTIIQDISNKKNLSQGEKIALISEKFLGTSYKSHPFYDLNDIAEKLLVDFRGLDCFSYLDYVTALQSSCSQEDFLKNIIHTRYINGNIGSQNRKHFFTDWAYYEDKIAEDITAQLSPHAITQTKYLNEGTKMGLYRTETQNIARDITYIPSQAIDSNLIETLKSGDLIGVYTPLSGLDVSHVGFFIMTDKGPVYRHASSKQGNQSVIDSPFTPYFAKAKGMIVLRLKQSYL